MGQVAMSPAQIPSFLFEHLLKEVLIRISVHIRREEVETRE